MTEGYDRRKRYHFGGIFMKHSSCYFQNKDCEYFPCHKVSDSSDFNCLFCYCPLYALGDKCGGKFAYTDNGIKDCCGCLIPHSSGGYDYVISRFSQVAELAKQK